MEKEKIPPSRSARHLSQRARLRCEREQDLSCYKKNEIPPQRKAPSGRGLPTESGGGERVDNKTMFFLIVTRAIRESPLPVEKTVAFFFLPHILRKTIDFFL